MTNFSRRQFIITSGATTIGTILAHGCSSDKVTSDTSTTNGAVNNVANVTTAANTPKVETSKAKLGFIPLTDLG